MFAQVDDDDDDDDDDDAYVRLHKSGSLWLDEFKMIEFDEIMRQRR